LRLVATKHQPASRKPEASGFPRGSASRQARSIAAEGHAPASPTPHTKECTMSNHIHSKSALLSGVAALAFVAGAAIAAPQENPSKQATDQMMAQTSTTSAAQAKFDLLDANHDGAIDKQEAAASKVLTAEFSKLDANNDGKLSLTEFVTVKDLASIKVDNKGGGY
jgi:EF hand domain-containing protein